MLVTHFQRALKSQDALMEFRTISQMFRDGQYEASAYYEHCRVALGDRFHEIFPELIALLPTISKQQVNYTSCIIGLKRMDEKIRFSLNVLYYFFIGTLFGILPRRKQ